jgi:hypothetical protein
VSYEQVVAELAAMLDGGRLTVNEHAAVSQALRLLRAPAAAMSKAA